MPRTIDRTALAFAVALTASSAANAAGATPDGTVTCTIPQPCALYKNSNGIGLSATSAKSDGLYGATTFSATSTSNRTFGVAGVDLSTNKNKFDAGLYGSSPYGYGLYASAPSGTAVYATSTSGVGVRAATTSGFAIDAASSSNLAINATSSTNTAALGTTAATSGKHAGLMGVDRSTNSGINDGVFGMTTSGGYGVEGTSNDSAEGGVYGSGTTGIGVTGQSVNGLGVYGTGPTGVNGVSTSSTGAGVFGSGGTSVGVYGVTSSGVALEGSAQSGDGLDVTSSGAGVGVRASNSNGNGSDISGTYIGLIGRSDSYPMVLTDAAGNDEFYVTGTGETHVQGDLYVNGGVYVHGGYHTFVRTRDGGEATAFTTRSTTSNVEDSGTAELMGGAATVRFDRAFAAAIDAHAVYQVFLTPGGDTRGLYVASKTPAGFTVRETQGGRGTLSFDYRILAAAPGHAGDRMALVSPASARAPHALPNAHPLALPKTPSLTIKHGKRE